MAGQIPDSPFGEINIRDKIGAIRAVIYGAFQTVVTFLGLCFGPEFFQKIADIAFGINLPINSFSAIIISLVAYAIGSAATYFAEIQRRKFRNYIEKDKE